MTIINSCLVLAGTLAVQAGEFVNLGFDDGSTNGITLFSVSNPELGLPIQGAGSPAQLLPGWSTLLGDEPVVYISYNRNSWFAPLTPHFNVFDTVDTSYFGGRSFPISGKFALLFSISGIPESHLSISQTGTIPVDAQWLSFHVLGGPIALSVDGREIFPTDRSIATTGPVSGEAEAALYDVSPFAGQTVDLRISSRLGPITTNPTMIDGITFVIPEPGPQSLILVGGLIALVMAARKSRTDGG